MKNQPAAAAVLGTGVLTSGHNFYLVSSQSEAGRAHVVTQFASHLTCDCKGFSYRGKCAHVAAVVAHKQALQLARAAATLAETDTIVERVTARLEAAPESSQPQPAARPERFAGRDNRAFSLMAQ